MPGSESNYTPPKTFHPQKQAYPNTKVWKTGDGRTEAVTGRHYISQTFYAEDENGNIESFDHAFYLQSYYREEWLAALKECGFEVAAEYKNREKEPWSDGDGWWIVEAVKSKWTGIYKQGQRRGCMREWDIADETEQYNTPHNNLRHCKIDLDTDRDYVLECHCRVNYECDTPWIRKLTYEQYRTEWFANAGQQEEFLSHFRESMEDSRTIAEIIKSESGETVGYLWVPFHAGTASFMCWADVQDIYVEEAHRRIGVAHYLMDYAEQSAKRNGAKVIRSGTGCENVKSQGLHQKLGYYQYRFEYEKMLRDDTQNG